MLAWMLGWVLGWMLGWMLGCLYHACHKTYTKTKGADPTGTKNFFRFFKTGSLP